MVNRHRGFDGFERWITIYKQGSDHVGKEHGIAHGKDWQLAHETIQRVAIGIPMLGIEPNEVAARARRHTSPSAA
jgi:hypothetical protein